MHVTATAAVRDHQPLALPWDVNVDLRVPVVLFMDWRRGSISKYTGKKLEDAINRILVFLVSLPRCHGLLPEMLVRFLQFVEFGGNGLLMAFNRRNTVKQRVHVQHLI